MDNRLVELSEIESLISTEEAGRGSLLERVKRADQRLKTLYALRDFVNLGLKGLMDRVEVTDETHPLTLDSVTGSVMPRPAGLKKPPADSSVAVLVDYILRLHADEVRSSGETPGMRPSEIAKEIDRQFGVDVAAKPINGRLWYLKSRNMVGWRENFYFLKDPMSAPAAEAN